MTIINDDSRVVNKLEASLIDDARVVIYNRHMFIVQATEVLHSGKEEPCSKRLDKGPNTLAYTGTTNCELWNSFITVNTGRQNCVFFAFVLAEIFHNLSPLGLDQN